MDSPTKEATLPSLGGTLGFGEALSGQTTCTVCGGKFASASLYDSHLTGLTHKAALQKMGFGKLGGCEEHYAHISTLLEPVKDRVKT